MAGKVVRGVIVGASSLLGRDLAEELNQAPFAAWDLKLLDSEDAGGQLTAAGDEALLIQPVTPEAFAGAEIVFFAGDAATARNNWRLAHDAGASIVDLAGALQGLPDVLLRCPWTAGGQAPGLATVAVSVAHPAALMLATAAARLQRFGLRRMAATVLEPASQYGAAGVDEMHQQTVALLSFKPLDQAVFGGQAAFNLRASLGSEAKGDLSAATARIGHEASELTGGSFAEALSLQVLQAPVFHGTTASVFVELNSSPGEAAVCLALAGEGIRVASGEESISNESVSGSGDAAVAVRAATLPGTRDDRQAGSAGGSEGSAFWLWMAADNLRLVARAAASCAAELAALRPASPVC